MKTKSSQRLYYEQGKYWVDDYGRKREATPEEIEEAMLEGDK